MRTLFNLVRPEEYGRGDIDAVLELEGAGVPKALRGQQLQPGDRERVFCDVPRHAHRVLNDPHQPVPVALE